MCTVFYMWYVSVCGTCSLELLQTGEVYVVCLQAVPHIVELLEIGVAGCVMKLTCYICCVYAGSTDMDMLETGVLNV